MISLLRQLEGPFSLAFEERMEGFALGNYAGAIPEFTAEEVDGAFPTECVELPQYERIARELLKERPVLRSTHDIARWIRDTFQR